MPNLIQLNSARKNNVVEMRCGQKTEKSMKAGCAPEIEAVRGKMLEQWRRGVSMRSLAVMYQTTNDEVEATLRDRLDLEAPRYRRAA